MVSQKWVAISYCCAFLSIFFVYLAYSVIAVSINQTSVKEVLPQAEVMNATSSALYSVSSWTSIPLSIIMLIILLIIIFLIINSVRSMGMAYAG